ncbi:Hypothetical predicted protein [Cloeon dipterum]|uniref:VWFA domain-containing protein n=1 Tax=Cloeon dipterum TaxID=197152 RepID=A0A8S1DSU7_9INSE|nr:Hypothetical predicted protein [Cloeon dipterum]
MSVKAFECLPVLETSQLLADLRPQTKIESIESSGSELYLGTYDGLILVYNIEQKHNPDGRTSCSARKERERYLSTRKPIKCMKAASASERLLVMSNNCIYLVSMSSLEPIEIDDPFSIQICVATKKKIEVYTVNESKFTLVTDVATSEPVHSLGFDGYFICIALMTKYKIFNYKTKIVQELFEIPTVNFVPIVRRIQQGEFLLTAPEGLGMFVTTEGSSNRAPIQWMVHSNHEFAPSGVISTTFFHPYILALCGNFIVVHSILDQQQKQSEHFVGGIALGNFDGRLYVCSSNAVFCLCPVAFEKQVQALLADKKVDEALDLVHNANYSGYTSEQFGKLSQRFKQQAAFAYFATKEFQRAQEMFIESAVDVREVISLFPNLMPEASTFVRSIPPLHEIADVDQLYQKDEDAKQQARLCMRQLLEQLRDPTASHINHQFELDTALVKLYAESNKDNLAAFILAGDVQCDIKDCLHWLERLECFNAVALLHKQSKNSELALEFWARLAREELHDDSFQGLNFFAECLASTKDLDLVWKHAAFVLQRDEEAGAKIFTCRSKDQSYIPLDVDEVVELLQKFPKALVQYLEYLVLEEKNQDEKFHSRLAVIYLESLLQMQKNGSSLEEISRFRKKFQRFLHESNLYRVQTVLSKIKGMGLDQETATLYGKLGDHDKALTILVHRLKDYSAAEEYCEANTRGKSKSNSADLFHSLLNCYLDPSLDQERKEELVQPALDLINRKAKMFNVPKVLELLPKDLTVAEVESFLCGALRSSMHQFRMKKVESSLAKGETIQKRHSLFKLQKETIFLQDCNYCYVCKKPFQDGSFARYPNNVITHVTCAKQNDVCPVTGRIFRHQTGSFSIFTMGGEMWAFGILLLSVAVAFGNFSNMSMTMRYKNNELPVELLNGMHLSDLAKKIGSNLRQISNEEMGLATVQETFDNLPYGPPSQDDSKRVSKMVEKAQYKLQRYTAVLNQSRAMIEALFWNDSEMLYSTAFQCCVPEPDSVDHGTRSFSCIIAGSSERRNLNQGPNITESFAKDLKLHPAIKSLFFVTSVDLKGQSFNTVVENSSPCLYDTRHRDVFFDTVEANSKKVLILIDHGKSMSENQMSLARVLSKKIINSLSPTEHVGLMAVADEVTLPNDIFCVSTSLSLATQQKKTVFFGFIDNLSKSNCTTNHSLGLKSALESIRTVSGVQDNVLLIYITRGLPSTLEESKVVMHTVGNIAQIMPSNVIISAAALVDDGKPMMLEKQFMQDLTSANFLKYNLTAPRRVLPGVLQIVNSTSSISFAVANLFKSVENVRKQESSYSLPNWDGQELVVSITQPCLYIGKLLGEVGLDVQLSDLVEDVTYFTGFGFSPNYAYDKPMFVDIENYERIPNFKEVRQKILSESYGSHTVVLRKNSRNYDREQVRYSWQHMDLAPYIMVIVSNDKGKPLRILQKVSMPWVQPNLVFHRLDLLLNPSKYNLCRHQRQIATLDSGSIFLSPSCFQSPFEYSMSEDIPPLVAKSYMDFIFNEQGANPGLKSTIKNDVGALTKVIAHWKNMMQESIYGKYIVRSFAATPSGIFQVYPGSGLDHMYDPTRQPWYTRALKFPGQVVLSTPYLDPGGAGYIVTISHTVYEGQSAALHSPLDTVAAVLGIDVTIGFIYKLLLQNAPFCKEANIKCMLIDNEGYLLAHRHLADGRGVHHHLTQKEPLVANDMLFHESLVRKLLCSSYADQTRQRYYSFNTSLDKVLTNLQHSLAREHCAKYQITAVPGTNILISVVNTTCDSVSTFCPCGVTDRMCLNCIRMEQTECECPCECNLSVDFCTGELQKMPEMVCPPPPEVNKASVHGAIVPELSSLEPCFPRDCEYLNTYNDCLGVVDCEWCVMDIDETPLKSPFCTIQSKCFNGMLGMLSPYRENSMGGELSDASGQYRSTPFGSVAGACTGIGFTIIMLIFCYTLTIQRQQSHAVMSSVPETHVPMSTLDNEVEEWDRSSQSSRDSHKQQPIMLEELPVVVSPYRVSTKYRRPTGAESDHGYSTMTPHDDSEHSPPNAEPLLLAKPVRTSSNLSSPTTIELMPLRQFQAPVTVHMVDTL